MTQPHDRRAHADALRRHTRSNQAARFKRQAVIMLASVALGGMTLPYIMLDRDAMLATGTYYWAKTKLLAVSGWKADIGVDVHYPTRTDTDRSARQIIAHPYFRHRVDLVWTYAIWGCGLGFAGWLAALLALRGAMARRRERALRDRVIAGTLVTSEKRLAKLIRDEIAAEAKGKAEVPPQPRPLAIGTVPIPVRLETRHMAMIGTTGSGKTTALRQLLDGIEARGEAALVYDTTASSSRITIARNAATSS